MLDVSTYLIFRTDGGCLITVLRGIFGPKRDEKLHHEKLHSLFFLGGWGEEVQRRR
jgi:hypothetical protein